jgi:very-short-patch-repair endonuclease
VVENKAIGSVVMLIELDDRTHRADQDARRDKMTAAAGYSTLRLPASVTPSCHNVKEQIHEAFARRPDLLPRGVRQVLPT